MIVKSELLKKMIAKASQGSTNNKLVPLSGLMGIEVYDDALSSDHSIIRVTTADGSNQFRVFEVIDKAEPFYTIVNSETFAKLVSKTTKENIELINNDKYLEVRGNGTYKLDIAINEEGQIVKFPVLDIHDDKKKTFEVKKLQEMIKTAKSSISRTMNIPVLTGYYMADRLCTTDGQLVCNINEEVIDEPVLVPYQMGELLLLVDGETIDLYAKDNDLMFMNSEYCICGRQLADKEDYPIKPISNLLSLGYESKAKFKKEELLSILDRMTLFVSEYDKNGVYLKFTSDELEVRSQKSNAVESIELSEVENPTDYECLVNVEMLKSQLQALTSEVVELDYGQKTTIKLVEGNTSLVIALLSK